MVTWLSRAQVAEHLGVSPRTVSRLVERGMPHCRTAASSRGHLRFDVDEVDRWFADQSGRTPLRVAS